MGDLDRNRVQQESRRYAVAVHHPTRYSQAVDRYLGAVGYRTAEAVRTVAGESATTAGVVVVGADETPTSYTAVDHAAIEAELRGWDLRIVHVQRPGGLRTPSRNAGARLLERLTDRVHGYSPSVPVSSTLAVGSASHVLLGESRGATLVVVGHRHSSAGTAFGISVGDRVAAQHTGPVLIVRVPGWPPGPGFGERPVVAGVARPGLTTPEARFALAEAKVRGCELVLLHASPVVAPAGRRETVEGVRVQHRAVQADPVAALIDASNYAAAVVLGRRAVAGNPVGGLLGSISRTMVQHAYCPIFLVG